MSKIEYAPAEARLRRIIEMLPPAVRREISSVAACRRDFSLDASEIRLRSEGECTITLGGETLRLSARVRREEFIKLFERVTEGAVFSHRSTLREGYIPLGDGVRLGVCGDFSESGELRSPTSFVFRIPCAPCEVSEELYSVWESSRAGMLIYSGAGGGKTSALRALTDIISRRTDLKVVAVDERYEFTDGECPAADILRGNDKPKGIEIAKRVLAAEVILVDEIGSLDESRALLSVGRGGAIIIATAHARTLSELCASSAHKPLIESGSFKHCVGLEVADGVRRINVAAIDVAICAV